MEGPPRRRFLVKCLVCGQEVVTVGRWHPNVSAGCAQCGGKLIRRLLGDDGFPVGYGPRRAKTVGGQHGYHGRVCSE